MIKRLKNIGNYICLLIEDNYATVDDLIDNTIVFSLLGIALGLIISIILIP